MVYYFLFQKTEDLFNHFHKNNFDIFKIYRGAGRGYWSAERIRLQQNTLLCHVWIRMGIQAGLTHLSMIYEAHILR